MSNLKIQNLKTESLIPYARNAKKHDDAQVALIAGSIREFGFNVPVAVRGEPPTIVAGHGRVLAARKLGLAEVPCVRLDHLSDVQMRAYILADNKLAEKGGGWDEEMLRLEVEELAELDVDLGEIGISEDELAKLTNDGTEGLTNADETPEPPAQPVSVLGDVWLLGKHRVMCGSSTEVATVEKLMGGEKAALIHADPPYGMGKEADGVANDNLYAGKLDAFQMDWWRAYRPFIEPNASAYIWGNAPDLWRLWWRGGLEQSERMTMRNHITWYKGGGGFGVSTEAQRCFFPGSEHALFFMLGEQGFNNNADNYWEGWEPIRKYLYDELMKMEWGPNQTKEITGVGMHSHWFTKSQWMLIAQEHYEKLKAAAKGKAFKREHDELKREFYSTRAHFDNTHEAMTDVWEFPRVTGDDRCGHATPKPVPMMERIMRSSLPADGLCVEPFGGSGSTLIGAESTGRICYTMELQEKYVDVIVTRWQEFTGKQATHADTGLTFDATKAKMLGK